MEGRGKGEGAVGTETSCPSPTPTTPTTNVACVQIPGGSKDEKPLIAFFGAILVQGAIDVFSPIEQLKSLLKIDIYRLNEAEYIHRYLLFVRKFHSAMDWIKHFRVDKHQEISSICTG